MDRRVYDYNLGGYWVEPIFLVFFGLIWTPIWTYAALHGPIPLNDGNDSGQVTGTMPNWVGFLLALLGIGIIALGISKAMVTVNEQVRIEDGDLVYVDRRKQVRLRCQLSDVRGLYVITAPYRFTNGRASIRAYRVDTTQGSFVFVQTIRNGAELFQILSDQIRSNPHGTPLDLTDRAQARYPGQI